MNAQLAFDDEMAARMDVLYRRRDMLRRRQLVRAALAPAVVVRVTPVASLRPARSQCLAACRAANKALQWKVRPIALMRCSSAS